MRYIEFRDAVSKELGRVPSGLTWAALRKRLKLPYHSPCPEWVKQMQGEIGLLRERDAERAFTWKLKAKNGAARFPRRTRNGSYRHS